MAADYFFHVSYAIIGDFEAFSVEDFIGILVLRKNFIK